MSSEKKSKGWPKIGTLRKGEFGHYIVLEKGVEILVDGEKININDKRTVRLEDPRKKIEQLLEKSIISEEKATERIAILDANPWLKYELIVPPPKPA